ncbi:hypothetical protein D3C79_1031220 [compost metagenome]
MLHALHALDPFRLIDRVRAFDSLDFLDPLYPHPVLENLDPLPGFQAVAGVADFYPLATLQVAGGGFLSPLDSLPGFAVVAPFDPLPRLAIAAALT